jgi:hypothetical protein
VSGRLRADLPVTAADIAAGVRQPSSAADSASDSLGHRLVLDGSAASYALVKKATRRTALMDTVSDEVLTLDGVRKVQIRSACRSGHPRPAQMPAWILPEATSDPTAEAAGAGRHMPDVRVR